MRSIAGWDIGAANVKAAWLGMERGRVVQVQVASQPFEIWREKDRLQEVLRSVLAATLPVVPPQFMAVTMTAELSDIFATKREGVLYVLECLSACFPSAEIHVLNITGEFILLSSAKDNPLKFAATNWLASAQWISRKFPNCLIIDVGSTTTDIIPIMDGKMSAVGRSDRERLSSGELVYTGILRTNLAAIVHDVTIAGQRCRVASEYFSVSGDVHLILGHLLPSEYTCTTPDGQPPSIESARRRLARLVCADSEMLSNSEIDKMARSIYDRQIDQVCDGIAQVISHYPLLRNYPVITLGAGAFLGVAAAKKRGLETIDITGDYGYEKLAVAPCLAAAHLFAEQIK
jgi:(4-(4-[2-(gamma-L-glutamylamino)ethyl]phenoxymethyl)furan-2-yl)methanamine synthase